MVRTHHGEDLTVGAAVTLLRTTGPTSVVAGPDGTLYVLSVDAVHRPEV